MQEDLKKEFPNGYYVLPSSIHEVLIVDQSFVEEPLDLFALKEAVLEVNYQVVDPSEFLSNEVYEVKGPDFQLEKATFLNHKKKKYGTIRSTGGTHKSPIYFLWRNQ